MRDSVWAIILAAGSGSRMGKQPVAKQFLSWRGRPLYWHSALTMSRSACVDGIVFVFPEGQCAVERERLKSLAWQDNLALPWHVAPGGARRQDSCRNGLASLPEHCRRVLIHDAARPFVSAALVRRVCDAISPEFPCIVPGVFVTDTIKLLAPGHTGLAERTLPRERLIACQTPQGFWTETLKAAHEQEADVTDDAMMLESMGQKVKIVPGEEGNRKITTQEDLRLLAMEPVSFVPITGMGYDVHRFGPGRPLRLGGVPIGGDWQVIAHSDGDVLLHALMDALLALAALGDIGRHFPDSDPALDGISSAVLLDKVLGWLREHRIRLSHADLTVVAQKPRLAPHGQAIKGNVARLLGLDAGSVNFKATTEEGLGFTGAVAGIKAYAVVSALKFVPVSYG